MIYKINLNRKQLVKRIEAINEDAKNLLDKDFQGKTLKAAINDIADPNFNALVGRDALIDTMGDMIEVLIGAFIMCMIGYVMLKYAKVIKEKLNKRRNNKKAVVEEDNQNDDAE